MSIELSNSLRRTLSVLVELYSNHQEPITGDTLAKEIDPKRGTIRNQMRQLRSLQLVESVCGPKGGYKPTSDGYEHLNIKNIDDLVRVPLIHDGERLSNVNVDEVHLTSMHDPERCRAEIHLLGPVPDIDSGDSIVVGPTPVTNLRISGTADVADQTGAVIRVYIDSAEQGSGRQVDGE